MAESSKGGRSEESDADAALRAIVARAAQFRERLTAMANAHDTGSVRFEVKVDKGRVVFTSVNTFEGSDPRM